MSNSESSIESFKKTNKIISPDQAISDVTSDYKNYQSQLLLINTQLSLYQSLSSDVRNNGEIGKFLLSISGLIKQGPIYDYLNKLQLLIDERDQIRLQATENAQVSKSIETRLQNQKEIIYKTINNEVVNLQGQKQSLALLMRDADNKFIKIPERINLGCINVSKPKITELITKYLMNFLLSFSIKSLIIKPAAIKKPEAVKLS